MTRFNILRIVILCGLAGCRSAPPTEYPTWYSASTAPSTAATDEGFGLLVQAGIEAEKADPIGLHRVSYTPGQRAETIGLTKAPLSILIRAVSKPIHFEYKPFGLTEHLPARQGWRLLGRVLVWSIEDSLARRDDGAAVESLWRVVALSSALMHGCALDVDLGLTLQDDARRAIAPHLGEMSPGSLDQLAKRTGQFFEGSNWLDDCAANEKLQMLSMVQYVQDAYRGEQFDALEKQLGPDIRDAVTYLRDLRKHDGTERAEYFKGFAGEIEWEINAVKTAANTPPASRREIGSPEGKRPWKRFARQFFGTMRPLIEHHDVTITRMRLMVLKARLMAMTKSSKKAPASLATAGFNQWRDPMTGKDFAYTSFGTEFRVYSIGIDQVDNGGRTNQNFSEPDLTLEGDQ